MNFFKFIKNYMRLKKAIDEIRYRKLVADNTIKNIDASLKNYRITLSSHMRKKIEFYKGKSMGYENSIAIIEKFINTGELPDNK